MNIADLPPGWWVFLGLPDGRLAIADAEDPADAAIVAAIRRRDCVDGRAGTAASGAPVRMGVGCMSGNPSRVCLCSHRHHPGCGSLRPDLRVRDETSAATGGEAA